MLNTYALTSSGPKKVTDPHLPDDDRVGWIDLLNPTPDEDKSAEGFLGVLDPHPGRGA